MTTMGIATNKKIIELYNMMIDKSLILQPDFQRSLVWNNTHKERFLETILKKYPFPEVYFSDGNIDLETKKSQTLVVDGQQRLNTIYQYIVNDNALKLKKIPRYSELDPKTQTEFFDYNVVVRDLGRMELEDVKEIFNRINSVQYALNAMEINNALYEGEFIQTAKEIIEDGILSDLEVFGENESTRKKDLEFITIVMTTIEIGGYFTSNNEVENYIKRYDDEYPNKEVIKGDIVDTLSLVKKIKLPEDTLWYRRSSFFTLVVELIKFKRKHSTLPKEDDLFTILTELEQKIMTNKENEPDKNQYSKFYKYMYQGTAGRGARVIRGEVLENYLESLK